MRRAWIAGVLAGGAAIAGALLALAPDSAAKHSAPVATPAPSPEPSLAEAIARLSGEARPLPREYAPPIDVPFQPIPEPGTGALLALGLALLPRLARSRRACHPAR